MVHNVGIVSAASSPSSVPGALTIAPNTDSASTGTVAALGSNNISMLRLTSATLATVNGIANGAAGKLLFLINATGGDVTVNNLNGGAVAANQIITGSGGAYTFVNTTAILLIYDDTTAKWRLVL